MGEFVQVNYSDVFYPFVNNDFEFGLFFNEAILWFIKSAILKACSIAYQWRNKNQKSNFAQCFSLQMWKQYKVPNSIPSYK